MGVGVFAFFAALAVISALGVILQRSPVHSLLALVVVLLAIAVLLIGLGAPAIGFLQAIVYVGAILVLFLFVIWLLNLQTDPGEPKNLALKFFSALAVAVLTAELFAFFVRTAASPVPVPASYGSVNRLADLIFSDYLVAFEVTSLLLLVAVVGAIAVARRWPANEGPRRFGASEMDRTEPRQADRV
jgi:NADH-quinone oxidoreductase subunit J